MKRCFGLEFLQFYRSQKEKKLYYRNECTNYVCILNYCKLSCPRREITWKVNHSLASLTANEKAASYQKESERDLQNLHCSWYVSIPLCLWACDSMSITFLCQVKWTKYWTWQTLTKQIVAPLMTQQDFFSTLKLCLATWSTENWSLLL